MAILQLSSIFHFYFPSIYATFLKILVLPYAIESSWIRYLTERKKRSSRSCNLWKFLPLSKLVVKGKHSFISKGDTIHTTYLSWTRIVTPCCPYLSYLEIWTERLLYFWKLPSHFRVFKSKVFYKHERMYFYYCFPWDRLNCPLLIIFCQTRGAVKAVIHVDTRSK